MVDAHMSRYLKSYGYTSEQLEKMDAQEITQLFEDQTRQNQAHYNQLMQEKIASNQNTNQPSENRDLTMEFLNAINGDNIRIYEADDFVSVYTPHEIAELLVLQGQKTKITLIEKMARVKIRELQEFWLDRIEQKLGEIPKEEGYNLMHYYTRCKEDFKMLKNVYTQLSNPEYIEKIKHIANVKIDLIKQYMPDEMERSYRDFFNHSEVKLDLVSKILELDKGNDKQYLLTLSIDELNEFYEKLQIKNKQEESEEIKVNEYMKLIKDALYNPDNQVFIDVCLQAAQDLPRRKFQDLVIDLSKRQKPFRNRFMEVAKMHKDFKNLQVIL